MGDTVRYLTNEPGLVNSDEDGRQFVALYVTTDLGRNWKVIPTPLAFHENTEDALTGFHDYRWPLRRTRRTQLKPPREV